MSILNPHYDRGDFFDEMFAGENGSASVRPHYKKLAERLGTIAPAEFDQRRAAVDLALLRRGVTFTV